jgi:hypothetical protein
MVALIGGGRECRDKEGRHKYRCGEWSHVSIIPTWHEAGWLRSKARYLPGSKKGFLRLPPRSQVTTLTQYDVITSCYVTSRSSLAGSVIFTCVRKISKTRVLASLCPSVRMEQLSSHWMDFHEIWYLSLPLIPPPPPRKCVEKIQVSLTSDKNNGYFTWRSTYIYDSTSLILLKMSNVSDKRRENQNKHFLCNIPFSENRAVYKIIWKNKKPNRPQMTI